MSSVATASKGAARTSTAPTRFAAVRNSAGADAVGAVLLAAGLIALAFTTRGGTDLGVDGLAQNTWAEIAVVALGALAVVAAIALAPGKRAWGAGTLAAFAGLTAWTAASIAWSVQPDNSWQATDQIFSYLMAFAGALALARLAPGRWRALVGALALAATVVSVWALVVKVFPATLDPGESYGRLRAPFDYWNATGLMAAMGIPACLWAAARREPARATRALGVPALAVLSSVVVLSYSRGAVAAAVIGVAVWFLVTPLRLRGVVTLALGAAGGAVISLYAIHTYALTHDYVPLAARDPAGHTFGLVLIAVLASCSAAGGVAAYLLPRTRLREVRRRQLGLALVAVVALIPLAAVGALVTSARGPTGEISHLWSRLTSTSASVGNNSSRLVDLSSSRARYWKEAIEVGDHNPVRGVGAGGFAIARSRYSTYSEPVTTAHGYVVQTYADLGAIGLAFSLALLAAWCTAAWRTVRTRRAPPSEVGEHAGMLTLLAIVIVFGVHSTFDWTWFVPGTAIPALLCAGWLAGRGPLTPADGRPATGRGPLTPADGRPATGRGPLTPASGRAATGRSATGRVATGARLGPAAAAAGIAVVALAAAGAWAIWQPLRSAQADAAAVTAAQRGNGYRAIEYAQAAVARDPLAAEPLWELGELYSGAGLRAAALAQFEDATRRQSLNPQTWSALGDYQLQVGDAAGAVASLSKAQRLDPTDPQIAAELTRARAAASAGDSRSRSAP